MPHRYRSQVERAVPSAATSAKGAGQPSFLSSQEPAPTGSLDLPAGCTFHRCSRASLSLSLPQSLHPKTLPHQDFTNEGPSALAHPFKFRGTPEFPAHALISWLRGRERETQGCSRCCAEKGMGKGATARQDWRTAARNRPRSRPPNGPEIRPIQERILGRVSGPIGGPFQGAPQSIAGRISGPFQV